MSLFHRHQIEVGDLQMCGGGEKLYAVKMVFQKHDIDVFGCIGTCCLLVVKIHYIEPQQVENTKQIL